MAAEGGGHRENARRWRALYDEQLRRGGAGGEPGGELVQDGPVRRCVAATAAGWSGILHSSLTAADAEAVIAGQIAVFAARGREFEWKYHDYDSPADLPARLTAAGFAAGEPETVLVGRTADQLGRPAPAGVRVRLVTGEAGVAALVRCHDEVFGGGHDRLRAQLLLRLAEQPDSFAMVVATVAAPHPRSGGSRAGAGDGGQGGAVGTSGERSESGEGGGEGDTVVCAGRVEFHPGTDFASLWGGGTLPGYRRRGIYRAVVAARAELAWARGFRYLQVDAMDASRPILERSGFVAVARTVPYVWRP